MEATNHCLAQTSADCEAYCLSRCRCLGLDTGIVLSLQAGTV